MLIMITMMVAILVVAISVLGTVVARGSKNLIQKIIGVVGYVGKGIMNLFLTNLVRTVGFFAIGATVAITTTLIAIIIAII